MSEEQAIEEVAKAQHTWRAGCPHEWADCSRENPTHARFYREDASIAIDTLRKLGWCAPGEVPKWMEVAGISENDEPCCLPDELEPRLFYEDEDPDDWYVTHYRLVPSQQEKADSDV